MRISDWSSDVCSSDLAGRRGDLRGEIALLPLDTLAELEADEVLERDRRARGLARLGDDVRDRGLVVDHEELAEQRVLLGELLDRAVDHLGDDIGGLARFGGLFGGDQIGRASCRERVCQYV